MDSDYCQGIRPDHVRLDLTQRASVLSRTDYQPVVNILRRNVPANTLKATAGSGFLSLDCSLTVGCDV